MRYGKFDHKTAIHTSVALTPERREALRRVALQLNVSQQTLLQRFISLGLSLYGED